MAIKEYEGWEKRYGIWLDRPAGRPVGRAMEAGTSYREPAWMGLWKFVERVIAGIRKIRFVH